MDRTRIFAASAIATCLLIAPVGNVGAASLSSAGLSRIDGLSTIEFVQDKKKSETIERKVKRAWRNLAGYKFEVSCLFSRTTCTETGKNREDARAKCQSQHPFCEITNAR